MEVFLILESTNFILISVKFLYHFFLNLVFISLKAGKQNKTPKQLFLGYLETGYDKVFCCDFCVYCFLHLFLFQMILL